MSLGGVGAQLVRREMRGWGFREAFLASLRGARGSHRIQA